MFKGGMGSLMKQAQKMQEQMQQAQEALLTLEVQGESGAGLVRVRMTGQHDIKQVQIDASLMSEDKTLLEDLLAAAVNDAVRKIEAARQEKLGDAAQGMGLPAGFKLPF